MGSISYALPLQTSEQVSPTVDPIGGGVYGVVEAGAVTAPSNVMTTIVSHTEHST